MMTFPERDDSHVDAKFFEGPHDYADFARNALANPDMAEALKNLKAANRARRQQSK